MDSTVNTIKNLGWKWIPIGVAGVIFLGLVIYTIVKITRTIKESSSRRQKLNMLNLEMKTMKQSTSKPSTLFPDIKERHAKRQDELSKPKEPTLVVVTPTTTTPSIPDAPSKSKQDDFVTIDISSQPKSITVTEDEEGMWGGLKRRLSNTWTGVFGTGVAAN
eukprot:TRINITY_DN390_c0_g1_i1.p1 TRINITY_DN390_c0_g1~~TRINITY_DN390_c0_g1_i1.p1  ORF type:complete len:162 (+),score=39.76 TRINITY_DN390_c0_g1_i1:92-577(+)